MNIMRVQGEYERMQGVYYEYDRDSAPLGEGGMGRIYQGYRVDEMSGGRIPVAIKEIHERISRDPQLIERAQRESSIQIDHENLLRMYGFIPNVEYDAMRDTNVMRYYMVMERLVGVDLDQLLSGNFYDRSGMPIPFAQELYELYSTNRAVAIAQIMKGVLSGIMALHDRGYIHRDIDPSNVMITIQNRVKLIDFGVCKQVNGMPEKSLTQAGSFIGKVSYAAPELALGDVSHQSYTTDIYALGVLIYQLYTGHLPFNGTNQEVLSAHISKKMPLGDIDNKDIRKIVEKATQKQQDKRYQSAAEMIVDLDRVRSKCTTSSGKTRYNPTNEKNDYAEQGGSSRNVMEILLWALCPVAGLLIGLLISFLQ